MKIAAYQVPMLPSGSTAAVELVRRRVEWCEAENVRILLCPEAVLGGLADHAARPRDIGISVQSGELAERLAPLSNNNVTTIIGFTEADGDDLYNSAAVYSRGQVVGLYRKRHPARRSSVYRPGSKSPVFSVDGMSFGIMICNDTNVPELGTNLADRGARVLFVPSNNSLRREVADVLAETRAVDIACAKRTGAAVVRADVAGELGDRRSFGSSIIVDPGGSVLCAGRPFAEDILMAELAVEASPGCGIPTP